MEVKAGDEVEIFYDNAWRRAFVVNIYPNEPRRYWEMPPLEELGWDWGYGYSELEEMRLGDLYYLNIEGKFDNFLRPDKDNLRPFVPKPLPYIPPNKDVWDEQIDANPLDWKLRGIYADWLEDSHCFWLADGQQYQIANSLTPGPACVLESAWHEATWFDERQANKPWGLFGKSRATIKPEWCLPTELFDKLTGYILDRRDGGCHNKYAKSWDSRRATEIALAVALSS